MSDFQENHNSDSEDKASVCCSVLLAWQTSLSSMLCFNDAVTLRVRGVISRFSEDWVRAQCMVWALKIEDWVGGQRHQSLPSNQATLSESWVSVCESVEVL